MKILQGINHVFSRATVVFLSGLMLLSGYALWSNDRIYRSAEDVYNEILAFKPGEDDGEGSLSSDFDALRDVNPDICAWLTIFGTKIDYPVVQGPDNDYYMNRDVYRGASLAGSPFLDYRNSNDFSDPYLIIYGHHMDRGLMFGNLDLFRDESFFHEDRPCTIILESGSVDYEILAVMEAADSTREVFDPGDGIGMEERCDYIGEHSIFTSPSVMEQFSSDPDHSQVVAIVTCTGGATGTRLVLFLYRRVESDPMDPGQPDPSDAPDPSLPKTGDDRYRFLLLWCAVLIAAVIVCTVILVRYIKKRK